MDNTTYEFFIRRCWRCERFQHGANTDTWEDLLVKYINFVNASNYNRNQLEKEYQSKLKDIKGYLDKAYVKLLKNISSKKIEEQDVLNIKNQQSNIEQAHIPKVIFDCLIDSFEIIKKNNL